MISFQAFVVTPYDGDFPLENNPFYLESFETVDEAIEKAKELFDFYGDASKEPNFFVLVDVANLSLYGEVETIGQGIPKVVVTEKQTIVRPNLIQKFVGKYFPPH